jgi:hypothetical protein
MTAGPIATGPNTTEPITAELLIAVPEPSRFRFDAELLAVLAAQIWPGVEELTAQGQVADIVDRYLYLPGHRPRCELALHRGGDTIGVTAPTDLVAADAVAWLCAVSRPPAVEGVLLLNWARDPLRLTPDLTSADLLRLRRR